MSFTAAKSNPSQRSSLGIGRKLVCSPAPVRRASESPGPGTTLALLREAQTYLDEMPGAPGKMGLRTCLDELQRLHGGMDEWGRRADGSRPSDERVG